jgi:hypothetical protein
LKNFFEKYWIQLCVYLAMPSILISVIDIEDIEQSEKNLYYLADGIILIALILMLKKFFKREKN